MDVARLSLRAVVVRLSIFLASNKADKYAFTVGCCPQGTYCDGDGCCEDGQARRVQCLRTFIY